MFVFLRALGSFGVARIRGELISEVTRVGNFIICSKIVRRFIVLLVTCPELVVELKIRIPEMFDSWGHFENNNTTIS